MWDTQVISLQVHLCEQLMPWRWRWLGFVVKLTHVLKELIAYEWHWVMWLRRRRSRQDLAWWTGCKREGQVGGFGAIDRVAVKLEQDLAPMDEGNDEKQVRSRSMNQQGHVMIWSRSYHLWYGWCMCCISDGGDKIECARQSYICRAFYFTGHICIEKVMTGFKIDDRTIKKGKLICILVI
jgi:hypothetical protein